MCKFPLRVRTLRAWLLAATLIGGAGFLPAASQPQPELADRLIWVFGWNLGRDEDVVAISNLLTRAAGHGFNGAVLSANLDTLCQQPPAYFDRLAAVRSICDSNTLELIPSLFSIGYGGGVLGHDPNLAEGVPVIGARFRAQPREAIFVPDETKLVNGDFEVSRDNRFAGYAFHDQPGIVSFVDRTIVRSGQAAIRLENFTANPHGHGRVMQEVRVTPQRCYRVSLWVKSENLAPRGCFQLTVLAKDRNIAPLTFDIDGTSEWRRIGAIFNSLEHETVRVYAGVWGARAGRLWLDDWTLEEAGPLNVLHRPGTPVRVTDAAGEKVYQEGRDYLKLEDPSFSLYRPDHPHTSLKLTSDTRIRAGQELRVDWYHSMLIHDSQVTVCMAEPAVYEIFDHEAELVARSLRAKRFLLNMDEIRMGGTCRACTGNNMAELLGRCVQRQESILKRHFPGARVAIWSDMFDPEHNAHGDYYLVAGDFNGSWERLPREMILAVWGGESRPRSVEFFAGRGHPVWIACYYDADDLDGVRQWMNATAGSGGVRGYMYTPWLRKYDLLAEFAELVWGGGRR
jgi:hypothetical protein